MSLMRRLGQWPRPACKGTGQYLCKHAQPIEKERCPEYEFPANKDLQETGFNTRLVPEQREDLVGQDASI
jgi:hypothetical protein